MPLLVVYWYGIWLERIALLDKGGVYKAVAYFYGFLYLRYPQLNLLLIAHSISMVSYSTPYQVTRSWILSIVLRSAALLLNLASIGLISALFIHGIQDVLFMILVNIIWTSTLQYS